jgi:hypothetical protein
MPLKGYREEIFRPECNNSFASLATQGAKGVKACSELTAESSAKLKEYLSRFRFD